MPISHIFNFIYCYGFDFDCICYIKLQCLIQFYFILMEIKIKFQYYVCSILHLLEFELDFIFILSSLKASFFLSKDNGPFLQLTPSIMDFFINFFDNLITHDRDLLLGSLSSLDIQTPSFSFSPFGGWQGNSGTLGDIPGPKTTTATTLTKTATTTTTKTMMTITGR